jgi:putative ABC transport system substrate-binding protein
MERRSRRRFLRGSLALAGLGLVAGCGLVPPPAERPARLPRIGHLSGSGAQERADGFRQGLADHGYVEGRTIIVEWRNAEGQADRLPALAAELVGLPVDVLVADGSTPALALKDATDTIPIVMAMSSTDPVKLGLVASLARPGGNVTGHISVSHELVGKRLELFKAAVPGLSRVGVLWNPDLAHRVDDFREVEEAARALGLDVRSLEAPDPGAIGAAFERASAERVDGLVLIDNLVLTGNPTRLGAFALLHRLPMTSTGRPTVAAGGLLAYSANRSAQYRRTATYVDRILKGADPAEMPIERPTTFDLVINLKTARELGLTIPPSVLQQATELIQ